MARNRYLDQSTFRQYLAARADEHVGYTREDRACPISLYLENITRRTWNVSALNCVPQVDPEEGEDKFHLNHEFKPPKWAKEFILHLDTHFGREMKSITGAEALYVLDEYA